MRADVEKVEKPWGHELWFAQTDRYARDILQEVLSTEVAA